MRLLRCLGSARPTARISALSGAPRMPATRTRVMAADVRGRTNERRPNGKRDAAVLACIPRDSNEAYSRRHLPRLGRQRERAMEGERKIGIRARASEGERENSILQSHGIISNYCRSVGIVRGAPPERKLHLRGGSRLNTCYIPLTLSTQ